MQNIREHVMCFLLLHIDSLVKLYENFLTLWAILKFSSNVSQSLGSI